MPYIKSDRRNVIDSRQVLPDTAGELNYAVTKCIKRYLAIHPLNYQVINDIVGALDGAKAEFQRRIVDPYEDKKIQENGDVY